MRRGRGSARSIRMRTLRPPPLRQPGQAGCANDRCRCADEPPSSGTRIVGLIDRRHGAIPLQTDSSPPRAQPGHPAHDEPPAQPESRGRLNQVRRAVRGVMWSMAWAGSRSQRCCFTVRAAGSVFFRPDGAAFNLPSHGMGRPQHHPGFVCLPAKAGVAAQPVLPPRLCSHPERTRQYE